MRIRAGLDRDCVESVSAARQSGAGTLGADRAGDRGPGSGGDRRGPAGRWRDRGVWWYYLYGLCVKLPHTVQVLLTLVPLAVATGKVRATGLHYVGLPAVFVIASASVLSGMTIHFRYVLPAYGFLMVVAGGFGQLHRSLGCRILSAILCIFIVLSLHRAYPDHHGYFNELSGGVGGNNMKLLHSSVDWGQDLWLLEAFAEGQDENVYFCFQYSLPPRFVLPHTTPIIAQSLRANPDQLPDGIYAIERTLYSQLCDEGIMETVKKEKNITPLGSAGASVLLFSFVRSSNALGEV